MRTTVDIPDSLYRKLKAKAALEGSTVKEILVKLVQRELAVTDGKHTTRFPLIRGKETRSLNLTNKEIDEILLG
jgi:hypothetical protein